MRQLFMTLRHLWHNWTDTIEHEIPTSGRPGRLPPHRIAPGQRKIGEDEILKMQKEGTIQRSSCPWCSPVVLLRNKDGTIHFCVDHRKLNDGTPIDAYMLPRIDDWLEALRVAKSFCSITLTRSYWQIKVVDKDREMTAFGSHLVLYKFLCMPFGAPATFSRLMYKVLDGLFGKSLDDVIIYGKTFEETLANLRLVMAWLWEHNWLVKVRKCELFEKSIVFLGP